MTYTVSSETLNSTIPYHTIYAIGVGAIEMAKARPQISDSGARRAQHKFIRVPLKNSGALRRKFMLSQRNSLRLRLFA